MSPWSAGTGQGGSAIISEHLAIYSGGLSPVRGREAPCTPAVKVPLRGEVGKGEARGHRSGTSQALLFFPVS